MHRKGLNNYDKIELYKNISQDYFELKNIDKAIDNSKNILQIDNLNEWSISNIIELLKIKGDWEGAIDYLKNFFKVKKIINNKKLALYEIQNGRMLLKNKKFDESREFLKNH